MLLKCCQRPGKCSDCLSHKNSHVDVLYLDFHQIPHVFIIVTVSHCHLTPVSSYFLTCCSPKLGAEGVFTAKGKYPFTPLKLISLQRKPFLQSLPYTVIIVTLVYLFIFSVQSLCHFRRVLDSWKNVHTVWLVNTTSNGC